MRVLISGILGAAVSAGVWLGLEHSVQKDLAWLMILVGLVTGYCVHRAAGSNAGAGYLRGALAVVLSLLAIVGGQRVYAQYMQSVNKSDAIETVRGEEPDGDGSAQESDEPAEEDQDEEGDAEDEYTKTIRDQSARLGEAGRGAGQKGIKNNLTEMEMLWMCVSALVAYLVGKGTGPVAASAKPEEPSGGPPPEGGEQDA